MQINAACFSFINSREREALAAENDARYHALKMRWKELIQSYQPPVDPEVPESIPLYLRECQVCNASNSQTNTERDQLSETTAEQKASQVGEDQLVFLNLTAKVCFRFLICTHTKSFHFEYL